MVGIGRSVCALGLLLATAAAANDAPPKRDVAFARAALARLPVAKADRTAERAALRAEQLDVFAVEIARAAVKAPRSPRVWTALLTTIAGHESNLDTDIVANRCKPWQCDRGRARGAFQNQRVAHSAELWDESPGNIPVQVEMADRALRRSLTRCAPFAPYPAHVFRSYRGGSCSWPLKDEAARVATYLRLVATPAPKGGAS